MYFYQEIGGRPRKMQTIDYSVGKLPSGCCDYS